jgi:uncharacterized membrane protein YfcA
MYQGKVRKLCNRSKSRHVRKVARLLAQALSAVVGGFFVGLVPAAVLKLVLGVILIVSAVRIFYR